VRVSEKKRGYYERRDSRYYYAVVASGMNNDEYNIVYQLRAGVEPTAYAAPPAGCSLLKGVYLLASAIAAREATKLV